MTSSAMLGEEELVAFVGARDLSRSHQFYGELLGLRRVHSSDFANVYNIDRTQLRVTRVNTTLVAPYTVLGWRVRDIVKTVTALQAVGVEFKRYDGMQQNPQGIWRAPGGSLVAWFADPDGNTLSVQQAPGPC